MCSKTNKIIQKKKTNHKKQKYIPADSVYHLSPRNNKNVGIMNVFYDPTVGYTKQPFKKILSVLVQVSINQDSNHGPMI